MEKSRIEEKNTVKEFLSKPLDASQIWYTIQKNWWIKWKSFVNFDEVDNIVIENQPPGCIDNCDLMDGDLFNANSLPEYDFEIVPEGVWELLKYNYGCKQTDDTIFRRYVIRDEDTFTIEIQPIILKIQVYGESNDNQIIRREFNSTAKFSELEQTVNKEFNIPQGSVYQLIKESENKTLHVIRKVDSDLKSLGLTSVHNIYIDVRNSNGEFGFKEQRSNFSCSNGSIKGGASSFGHQTQTHNSLWDYNETSSTVAISTALPDIPLGPPSYATQFPLKNNVLDDSILLFEDTQNNYVQGVCGLSNLGNTCFMNSAIQCISNVPPITNYFIAGKWKNDLNKKNPLGMEGRIATAYANLILEMWSGKMSYALPRNFKVEVANFAPQFMGFSQHDAQELMMFLLDGLHEDLNRITDKPYIEQKNCSNQPDKVVADDNWEYHLKRNDSIIVDYFHGQLKSKVVCPDCKFVSVTFDPFAYLSLPLSQVQNMSVIYIPFDSTKPILRLQLNIYNNQTFKFLKEAILAKIELEKDHQIRMTSVHQNRIVREISDTETIGSVAVDNKIVFYDLPPLMKDHFFIDISFRCNRSFAGSPKLPLYIQLPRQLNWTHFTQAIQSQLNRFFTNPCANILNTDSDDIENGIVSDNIAISLDVSVPQTGCSGSAGSSSLTNDDNFLFVDHTDTVSTSSVESVGKLASSIHNPFESIFSISLVESGPTSTKEHEINPISRSRNLKGVNEHIVLEWSEEGLSKCCKDYEEKDMTVHLELPKPTIVDCLKQFLTEECLGNKDLWYCPQCKEQKAATKKLDIWRLPKVLVVHLKRFRAHNYYHHGDKINTEVQYPIRELDLNEYALHENSADSSAYIYDLVAVCNHLGGLGSGHYFSYAKNCLNNKWYKFDDSNTSEIDEEKLVTKSAYVLVYVSRQSSDDLDNNSSHKVNGFQSSSSSSLPSSPPSSSSNGQSVGNDEDKPNGSYMDVDIDSPE